MHIFYIYCVIICSFIQIYKKHPLYSIKRKSAPLKIYSNCLSYFSKIFSVIKSWFTSLSIASSPNLLLSEQFQYVLCFSYSMLPHLFLMKCNGWVEHIRGLSKNSIYLKGKGSQKVLVICCHKGWFFCHTLGHGLVRKTLLFFTVPHFLRSYCKNIKVYVKLRANLK